MDYEIDTTDTTGKTLKNVKLISTGIPARMRYYYYEKINNYSHWIKPDTDENKAKLTSFRNNVLGTDYTIYSGGVTYSLYIGLQASAGFYYNLGKMTFKYGTDYNEKNMGYYTKVKNGSTTYSNTENNTTNPTGNNLFVARNDAEIRMLTLPELNAALGRTDVNSTSDITDTTGLYQLNKISTGTALTNNKYTSGYYWLASPWPVNGSDYIYSVCNISNGGALNYLNDSDHGVRPVVSLLSDIQLTKQKATTTDGIEYEYYEIVDI